MKSGCGQEFACSFSPRVSADVTDLAQAALTLAQCSHVAARQDMHCTEGQILLPGTGRLPLNMCCNDGMEVSGGVIRVKKYHCRQEDSGQTNKRYCDRENKPKSSPFS